MASGRAPRLVLGTARTSLVPVEERGAAPHADRVAGAVRTAMAWARLGPDGVRLVLVKSPVLPANHLAPDGRAGSTSVTRAAGALGAALALGEVDPAALDAAGPLLRTPRHARRAMAFSGTELEHDEVVVLGNRLGAAGGIVGDTAPLADVLDVSAMRRLASAHGARWDADGVPLDPSRLCVLFLKLGVPPGGRLRGRRTTVLGSDLTPDKQLRAAANGVAGAVFASGGLFSIIAEAGTL